jgi:hypothetical protein
MHKDTFPNPYYPQNRTDCQVDSWLAPSKLTPHTDKHGQGKKTMKYTKNTSFFFRILRVFRGGFLFPFVALPVGWFFALTGCFTHGQRLN